MFSTPQGFGNEVILTKASYYTRLYEADVPARLLDFIGNNYKFEPMIYVRALHEGHPIAALKGRKSPSALDVRLGDDFLLVFASVALTQFHRLERDEIGRIYTALHNDAVREFVEAIQDEGFRYSQGQIFCTNGTPVSATLTSKTAPNAESEPESRPDPEPEKAEQGQENPVSTSEPSGSSGWSRDSRLALIGIILASVLALGSIIATIASQELRIWLHLEKPHPTNSNK